MTKLTMIVELTYDEDIMHHDSPEEVAWFMDSILLNPPPESLLLHSNELGDTIGEVKILSILTEEDVELADKIATAFLGAEA